MDIFCPHCQNHLSIEDQHAGQFLKCPLCSGMFTAPTLPTMTNLPSPPPPLAVTPPAAVETFALEPLPHEKRPSSPPSPPPIVPPATSNGPTTPPAPPLPGSWTTPPSSPDIEPPLPLGEYQRAFIVHFNPAYVRWFGPICLGLIVLLSFFSWRWLLDPGAASGGVGTSLWGLAFTSDTMGIFLPYLLFTVVGFVLSIVSMLLTRRLLVLPEPFKKLRPWRALIVAGVAALGLALLFLHWIYLNSNATVNWSTVAYKLSLRLHEIAVVSLVIEFWLDRRHKKNLPLPKIELRW